MFNNILYSNRSCISTSKTWIDITSVDVIRGLPKCKCSHNHSFMYKKHTTISNQLKYI